MFELMYFKIDVATYNFEYIEFNSLESLSFCFAQILQKLTEIDTSNYKSYYDYAY